MDPARVFTAHRKVMFSEASRGVGQTLPPPIGTRKVGGTYPTEMHYYYRPQRSWGKVIFSQVSVILSTGAGGGCLVPGSGGVCAGGVPRGPPGRLLLRVVSILLECILVMYDFKINPSMSPVSDQIMTLSTLSISIWGNYVLSNLGVALKAIKS